MALTGWRAFYFPESVTGGSGSLGAEEVAAWFEESFARKGFGGTLDYTQCYDMMHPELATHALRESGINGSVCNILATAWAGQERWIIWDGHTSAERLTGVEAMPQGDPWGPLTLNCYMLGGVTHIEEELKERNVETVDHEIYMDDRSWTAETVEDVLAPVEV